TRIWLHWQGLAGKAGDGSLPRSSGDLPTSHLEKVLATYERGGVEGIMVDFLNRDDQEMVRFTEEVLRRAAAHHLTVSFHGVFKPTGRSRTYPNLLTHEAVLGTEYNKWDPVGSPPGHELLVAFVRMLAGPLDMHQGSFRPVRP